ncbi:Ig-like domain-containing protein [soil metagenome]
MGDLLRAIIKWVRTRKALASAVVIALVAGIPLTIAALHPGFPVSDVDLTSRDVWVTNGEQLLGGRLNRQIDELNGSVVASSPEFEVLQDGDSLFLLDPTAGRIESVDPASTEVTSAVDVPKGAQVTYGGQVISIVSPAGEFWMISAVGDLQFNYVSTPPLEKLGKGAKAVVLQSGAIVAVAPSKGKLYRYANIAAPPEVRDFPKIGEFQIAGVGDQAVMFDQSTNSVLTEDGSQHELPEEGLRLQQTGAASSYAVVAGNASLMKVDLGSGSVTEVDAEVSAPATNEQGVSAPVFLEGCAHGAWSSGQRYLLACDGQDPVPQDIEQPTQGSVLEFRVNRTVIALNNLDNGNVWLVNENMRLVDNWEDVTPPEEQENEEEGDEKSATQSFEDTLAERTDSNRPPTAIDDDFGIRPGRTTILSLLDNDSDPDGDVLVISAWDEVAESTGTLDAIDGSRALQFTPAPGFVGTIQFGYTVDDGRGGTAQARVSARVVPSESNQDPVELRVSGTTVEQNQTVSYNVLSNWRDPDGDDLYLTSASPKSGDLVRFTPDGLITFTHATSELGEKEVVFQVTDGLGNPMLGSLKVTVKEPGSLNPVGTPDFATAFTNDAVLVKPLLNDISPSGAPLALIGMDAVGGGATGSFNTDRGEVSFQSANPGINYIKYTLQAGAKTSVGLIRIDIKERPEDLSLPPVAVKDTAYLRGDEPTTVAVLSNDVSPQGKILAVQSVQVPPEFAAKGFVAELLASTKIRVTSPQALTEQVNFTYTISDGLNVATAGVTVVPVPALTKHQPPVAANDAAKVRAGDVITVDVLANDFHPDNSLMTLDKKLITEPTDGLAFIAKNKLRFQAPETPGQYRVDYRVLDPFGETAAATATFTVTAVDIKNNREPVPQSLVGRVLAGGSIRIDVPLDGIDPDGDSVQILNFPVNPVLGSVSEVGPSYFIYDAAPGAVGTDEFEYQVYDAFGATGTATARVAVIPQPTELSNPSALPDSVSIRPGRIAQVDLLANDSDPQGAPIKVSEKLIDVPEGIDAEVISGQYLVVTAPDTVQSFSMRYELTNDRGGKTLSYALIKVDPNAPILPPIAEDVPILLKDVAGKTTVTVDVFDGYAFNPSGITEDMAVTVEGPNASSATLLEQNGKIEVTPGKTRQAIAYRVTNKADNLSAVAFILVPEAVDDDFDNPPYIDPTLPVQYVSMNESRTWKLKDILVVPSKRDAYIYDEKTVANLQSDGSSSYVDKETISFSAKKDYRGPASISFTVSDGSSANDPKGNKAALRFNIVVGDPEYRDTPPEFTTPNAQVELGEKTTIDLRESTGHPNPQILREVTYSNITGAGSAISANLSGSQLELSVPRNAQKGSTYTLGVTLKWDKFTVEGTINVLVVGSTRPLAVAVSDSYEAQRGDPATVSSPLVNDSNPYQTTGEDLKIVDAQVSNTGEPATISFTSDRVTIQPSPALKDGRIEVIYTIQDATEDADREVNGTITLVVSDVPDPVAKPQIEPANGIAGDQSASFRFVAPASNGKPITSYDVQVSPAQGTVPTDCVAGALCTVTGLTNGTAYTFQVRAVNMHGAGSWSPSSDPATPYGTPATPVPTTAGPNGWSPTASITWNWATVAGTGGTTTYSWRATNGGGTQVGSGSGVNLTTATLNGLAAGNYTIYVTATNSGGKSSGEGANMATVQNQTAAPAPGTPTGSVVTPNQPGRINWSWSAGSGPAQSTDNMTYHWEVQRQGDGTIDQGDRTVTNVATTPLSAGDYRLRVTAVNNAGNGGTSAWSAWETISIPPVNSNITLAADRRTGLSGCSHSSCGYPAIDYTGFGVAGSTKPAGNYSICFSVQPSGGLSGCTTVNLSGSGTYTYTDSGYVGYPNDTYSITVSGHSGLNTSARWDSVRSF